MKFPQPHTGSYYAASVNDVTDFGSLAGANSADICIVGAGFTGVSTALHLAERGYKVAVVEANRIGWGASGRNGGQIIGGIAGEAAIARFHGKDIEDLFADLRWAGHDIIRERVATYDIKCDLKWGYMDVALKARHMRDIDYDYERLSKANFPHEIRVLDRSTTAEMIGTDTYIGALLNYGNGHLHPLNLCIGEARAAERLGATFFEQSPVIAIEHGDRPIVRTATGTVTADAVVLAGNAYHHIEPKLRGVMFPVNSFIVATEPLDAATIARINPHDLAVCDPNFVLKYFRLSADKRMLFGGRFNYFGDDPEYIRAQHRKNLATIYPELANARFDYAWGGTIGVPVDRVPRLGRLSDNVYYCQGYSGHGVNVTHLAGKIMADAVTGTMESFDLFANVRPINIPGAATFTKLLVTLGMWYYHVKDRL